MVGGTLAADWLPLISPAGSAPEGRRAASDNILITARHRVSGGGHVL